MREHTTRRCFFARLGGEEFGMIVMRDAVKDAPEICEHLRQAIADKRIADQERALRAKADEVLEFLTVEHLAEQKAGQISGGQKKLLELGRTMMVDAKIVFLDEVGAGVNRTLLNTIGDAIIRLNKERGYTFVVIEHDMPMLSAICDRMVALELGSIIAEGTPAEIQSNEAVIRSYLGDDPAAIARSGSL